MTLDDLIAQARERLSGLLSKRQEHTDALVKMRESLGADGASITDEQVNSAIAARDAFDPQIEQARERVAELEAEKARDDAADALARQITRPRPSALACGWATSPRSTVAAGSTPTSVTCGWPRVTGGASRPTACGATTSRSPTPPAR